MTLRLECTNPGCGWSQEVTEQEQALGPLCPTCRTPLVNRLTRIADDSHPTRRAGAGELLAARPSRYAIVRPLGEGGMGVVYLAHDTQLDRPVALKFPRLDGPEERARFDREARAAARLRHPQFCPVFDIGELEGRPFMAMAFIEGPTLTNRLAQAPLPPAEAVTLIRTLARAFQVAHDQGVIHRDLKPGNVMFDARGEPVIMDFGLARLGASTDAQLTQTGAVFGTPAYMAPEQVMGHTHEQGPATDIYALGILLYQALTGRRPSTGSGPELCWRIVHEPPAPPSSLVAGLDPSLDPLCLRALAKSPTDRYPSMGAFADALDGYLAVPGAPREEPAGAEERVAGLSSSRPRQAAGQANSAPGAFRGLENETPATLLPPRRRRYRPLVALGALAVVSGAVVLVVALRPRGERKVAPTVTPPRVETLAPKPEGPAQTVRVEAPKLAPNEPRPPESFARTIGVDLVEIRAAGGRPFWLGKSEVTRAQFRQVMGRDPSCAAGSGDGLPVDNVSWFDAVEFCNALSRREHLSPYYGENVDGKVGVADASGGGFRLPTVVEWESACAAGRSPAEFAGRQPWKELAGAQFWSLSREGPRPVGQGEANGLGVADLLGNVWEWCEDAPGNSGSERCVRGGAYDSQPPRAFAEVCKTLPPGSRDCSCGFRVARGGAGR